MYPRIQQRLFVFLVCSLLLLACSETIPSSNPGNQNEPIGGISPTMRTNLYDWQRIEAPDGNKHDFFGNAVAIRGSLLAVSAFRDSDIKNRAGSVYLFQRDGDTWQAVEKFFLSDGQTQDYFGSSVALEENLVVVGAPYRDSPAGTRTGAVYVYQKNNTGWTLAGELYPAKGAKDDRFGHTVAVHGSTIVVGAPYASTTSKNSGAVYLFLQPKQGWTNASETTRIDASDGSTGDEFGAALAFDGELLLVGAMGHNYFRGAAWLYQRPAGGWTDPVSGLRLTAPRAHSGDLFGNAVACSSDWLYVGAYGENSYTGAVYAFDRQKIQVTASLQSVRVIPEGLKAGDRFGFALAAEKDALVVGTPKSDLVAPEAGMVYLMRAALTGWDSGFDSLPLYPDGLEHNNHLGLGVALEATTIVAGTDGEANPGEAAWIFLLK